MAVKTYIVDFSTPKGGLVKDIAKSLLEEDNVILDFKNCDAVDRGLFLNVLEEELGYSELALSNEGNLFKVVYVDSYLG